MTTDSPSLRWLSLLALVLLIPLVLIWWPGCRQYPPVTSREALSAMQLLYSACNTRDATRLAQVEQRLSKLRAEGKLSEAESRSFESILKLAKEGEWKNAEAAAFKFAQDQVGVGHPDPAGD